MNDAPKLSLVILNWNAVEVLRRCLESFFRQSCRDFEVIVVDNGSNDGSQELVKKNYPHCRLIENEENKGYCGGMNQGLRAAAGQYVWLLNNDVMARPDAVEQLLCAWSQAGPQVAALAPKVMCADRPNVFDAFGNRLDRFRLIGVLGEVDRGQYDAPRRVFGVKFVAPCFRRESLLASGAFDESFYRDAEDFDVSYRLNLLGLEFWTCPKVVLYHLGSHTFIRGNISTLQRQRTGIRNYVVSFLKNYQLSSLFLYFPFALARIWVYHGIVQNLRHGCSLRELASVHAGIIKDLIRMLPEVLKKRRALQASRKVSDVDIWKIGS